MKAVQIQDRKPIFTELAEPKADPKLVRVKVVSASICGSDLHMMNNGWAEQRVLGHELAGFTPDGTAVAVEPMHSCGTCEPCELGFNTHCQNDTKLIGVSTDGGMAEYVLAPPQNLVPLPSGLDITTAALVEPLAVALHGLNRGEVKQKDKVLIIGAGPIGLMVAAALQGRGIAADLSAKHQHQMLSAQRLGANTDIGFHYDVVLDAVGTSESLKQAAQLARPMAKIVMLGTFWQPVTMDMIFTAKELQLIAAMTYQCKHEQREFVEAGKLLAENQAISQALISHRFPLEGANEAFSTAADRAAGAIKVIFDVGSQ